MKRVFLAGLMIVVLMGAFIFAPGQVVANAATKSAPAHQVYTVLVGWDDMSNGAMINAYFPAVLKIHPGDTVKWVLNSMEFHTVTFLAGGTMPPFVLDAPQPNPLNSPLMANPVAAFPTVPAGGLYNGNGFVNSGLMAAPAQQFVLTFTKVGVYNYVCIVHGTSMSGKIVVVDPVDAIPSPAQASTQGQRELANLKARIPDAFNKAQKSVPQPVVNPDGTTTFFVNVGYAKGQIDLVAFFPKSLTVHPGDTVKWALSNSDVAPHTVTFLNGAVGADIIVPTIIGAPPPVLLLNPAVLFPSGGAVLTRTGIFNSGFMDPTQPGPHSYSLKIGDISGLIEYECLLHDGNGMDGTLTVTPR